MNTYTITFTDAHSNTFQLSGIAAAGGNDMPGKMAALLAAIQQEAVTGPQDLAAFTPTDTLTITVTQP